VSTEAEQGADAADGRGRDGEPGRDVRQERIELGGVGADLTLHKSCVTLSLKPGNSSDANELLIEDVCQPV